MICSIFSQSLACLFNSWTEFLAEQRFFFYFDKIQYISFFLLWVMLLDLYLRNTWLTSSHELFSSRSFIVLHFAFRSVIHFELIFVYSMKLFGGLLIYLFMHMDAQLV